MDLDSGRQVLIEALELHLEGVAAKLEARERARRAYEECRADGEQTKRPRTAGTECDGCGDGDASSPCVDPCERDSCGRLSSESGGRTDVDDSGDSGVDAPGLCDPLYCVTSTVTSAAPSPGQGDPVWIERLRQTRNIISYEVLPVQPPPTPLPHTPTLTTIAPRPAATAETPNEGHRTPDLTAGPGRPAECHAGSKIGTLPVAQLKQFRRFDCATCGKFFHTTRDLKQHISVVHEGVKPFQCSTCGQTFGLKGNLVKHVQNRHAGASRKTEPCPFCAREFSMKGNLTKHIQTVHHRIRPFSCDLCKALFSRRSNLNQHMILVHGAALETGRR